MYGTEVIRLYGGKGIMPPTITDKTFQTDQQQIDILQSRRVTIKDIEYATAVLSSENYYRDLFLIGLI